MNWLLYTIYLTLSLISYINIERLKKWSLNIKFVHCIENKTGIKPRGQTTRFWRCLELAGNYGS